MLKFYPKKKISEIKMSEEFQLKKFEDYGPTMPMPTILAFAKYGFICAQILKYNQLDTFIQEFILCESPG